VTQHLTVRQLSRRNATQGRIYEWDYQHGTVEIYDSGGAHQGEYDPVTAKQIKGPNRRRYVEP